MSFEDERIVKMTFDNKAFQKNIESTIRALERLDKSMKLEDVSPKAFDNFVDGVEESDRAMESFGGSIDGVKAKFSALQIVGFTVLSELTRFAISSGKKIYDSTLGQIKSGGLTRALNIEAAKFQIAGLGHTWEEVAEDIDYAVKDTAYGLDSAAKAASQLLASQIKAGDQMKVSLRGISGLAAVTNSSYDDIADIFTTVAGNGRLMGDQLNRISYRGINAAQTLMDYFNNVKGITVKTEAEIRDMVSKGKVSFMDFAAAMDYAFGEHAKDANKTFTGAISNMKAALSRIGEKFFTPWNEFERRMALAVIPVINRVKDSLSAVMPVIEIILDRTASWTEKLTGNYNFQKSILNVVIGIWGWIQNIIGAFDELGFHLPTVETLADFLEKITSVLVLNAEEGRKVRDVVKLIVKSLSIFVTILQAIWFALQPIFKPILSFLENVNIGNTGVINGTADIIDKINYIIKVIGILMHIGIEKSIRVVIVAIKALVIAIKAIGGIIGLVGLGISKLIGAIRIFVEGVRTYGSKIFEVIKSIGEGFEKFYNLVREILINITTGMSGFLDSAKTKTSELWDVINNLVGTKKLTIDLGFVAKGSAPNLKSFIPRDTASKINNATDAANRYNDSVSDIGKHSGAASIGSGHIMDFDFGIDDLVKLNGKMRDLGDTSRDVADQVENNTSRSTNAIRNMARDIGDILESGPSKKSSSSHTKKGSGGPFDIGGGGFKDDEDESDSKREKEMKEKGASIFDNLISGLTSAKDKLILAKNAISEHLTNFYSVISDIIIIGSTILTVAITAATWKIFSSLMSMVTMIPQLIGALSDAAKGFKYAGIADMLKSLALAILAIGGLVLVIGIVSRFADVDTFKQFTKIVIALIAAVGFLLLGIAAIQRFTAVMEILKSISDYKNLFQKTMGITNNLRNLFIALAVLLGTVLGSILILRKIAEKDGGYAEIYKGALFIAGLITGITVLMLIVTKQLNGLGSIQSSMKVSLKGITRTTTDKIGGLLYFVEAVIPLMVVLLGGMYMISKVDDMGKMFAAFGLVMGTLVVGLGTITGMMVYIRERLSKDSLRSNQVLGTLKATIKEMRVLVDSVSLFMFSMMASAAVLSLIPVQKQDFVFKMLTEQLIAIAVIGAGVALLVGFVSKKLNGMDYAKAVELEGTLMALSRIFATIGGSISALMLSMAASMAIISLIPSKKLVSSGAALAGMMAIAMLVITTIIKSTKSLNSVMSSGGAFAQSSSRMFNKFGAEVATLLSSVSIMTIVITGALGTLSGFDSGKLLKASLVLGGMMTAMLMLITVLIRTIKLTGKQTASVSGGQMQSATEEITGFANNAGVMLLQICGAMSALTLVITGAIIMLGDMEPGELAIGLIGFTIAFALLMTGIMVFFNKVEKLSNGIGGLTMSADAFKMLYTMAGIMSVMAGSIVAILGATALLMVAISDVDPASVAIAAFSLATILAFAIFATILLTDAINSIPKVDVTPIAQLSVMLMGVSLMMSASSTSVIALAAAAKIMNGVDWKAMGAAILAFASLTIMMGIGLAIMVKNADKINTAAPAITSITGVILALSAAIMAIAVAAAILTMVDWSNVNNNILGVVGTIGALAVLAIAIAGAAAIASKAVIPLAILAGAITVLAGVILVSLTTLFESYSEIIKSLDRMAIMDWSKLQSSAIAFKNVITILTDSIGIGTKNVLAAYLVGKGIAALASGLSVLETVHPQAIIAGAEGIKAACEAIVDSLDVVAWLAITIAFIGGLLAPNIILMSVAILLVMQMFPKFVSATDNAIAAIATCIKNVEKNIEIIVDSMKNLKNVLSTDELVELQDYVFLLAGLGVWMLIAGVALAVGTASFLVGAVLLMPAIMMLKTSLDMMNGLIEAGILVNGVDAMGLLIDVGFMMILSGIALSIGVSIMLPTAAVLLGCVALLCLALAQAPFLVSAIEPMVAACGGLELLAIVLTATGLMLLLPAAIIGLACSFLMPAVLLLAATIGVIFLASRMDFATILTGLGGITMILIGLLGIGVIAMMVSPILILGLAGLTIASILFMVTASMMLLGMASFTLALLAVWGAVAILGQIDFDGVGEKLLALGKFMAGVAVIGLIAIVASVILIVAGALLTVAAVLISVAIITLSVTVLIGAALLLASAYVLGAAFDQLNTVFSSIEWGTMLVDAILMIVFAALLGIAAIGLLGASIGLVIAGALLSVGGLLLGAAFTSIKTATEKKINIKTLAGNMMTFMVAIAILSAASVLMLPAAITMIVFGGLLMAAATTIGAAVTSLATTSELLQTTVEGFKNAGEMICDGITEGIEEGANRVSDTVEALAEGDVLGAFKSALGINSPAEEFIHAAANCIAGIAEGLGMDRDEVYNQIDSMGMGMLNTFGGFTDNFKNMGANLGDSIMGGFADSIKSLMPDISSGFLGDISTMLGGANSKMYDMQIKALENEIQVAGLSNNYATEQDKINAIKELEDERKKLIKERDEMAVQDYEKMITDQMGNWGVGSSGGGTDIDYAALSGETSDALSGVNTGKAASDASKIGGNVGTSVTNNTYNFTQNNFSPEPIDRTEIYTQTNNQLDTWYKWLRDNS